MDLSNIQANELAGLVVTESLASMGVRTVVVSPGSRSTPLTYAFAKDTRFETTVVLDERSAGFFALGRAKATQSPVVLVCTSGTAGANYLPAVIEARYSHVPLLVITADRPLMDQFCHAGQTIQQNGMFSSFVIHEQQLELPRSNVSYLRYLRETIREAVLKCHSGPSGVVHLNFPFEKPLTPMLSDPDYQESKLEISKTYFQTAIQPFCKKEFSENAGFIENLLSENLRCAWILGPDYKSKDNPLLVSLLEQLERLNFPVLVDALHPARGLKDRFTCIFTHYEWALNAKLESTTDLSFDFCFQIGNLPTSQSLRNALEQWNCSIVKVSKWAEDDNRDPTHSKTVGFLSLKDAINQLNSYQDPPSDNQTAYLRQWSSSEKMITETIDRLLTDDSDIRWAEPSLCRRLHHLIEHPCDLFVSNSMIVRDIENYFTGSPHIRKVISSRGANGIDGILSSAFGAIDADTPLLCITGDLAFLHDTGGFKLRQTLRENDRVLFVVLDNNGGGIFEHLPIATIESTFEPYFATPQTVDIPSICQAYQIHYRTAETFEEIQHELSDFFESEDSHARCLHLKFNRKTSYQLRKSTLAALQ